MKRRALLTGAGAMLAMPATERAAAGTTIRFAPATDLRPLDWCGPPRRKPETTRKQRQAILIYRR